MKLLNRFDFKELLRFLVGGGSAVLTDFISYRLLLAAGVPTDAAKAVSYVLGAAVGFVINKLWTFRSRAFSISEILKYIVLYTCSALVNTLVNKLVLRLFGINLLAFLAATGVSTVLNFLGQKFFVFRKGRSA